MKNTIAISLAVLSTLMISGCGGGGSPSTGGTPAPAPPSTPQNTGHVGDGYIEGAYVCHDSNSNMSCLDETYTTTAADGSFTLSNYDATLDVLVEIPVGAVDNGPFADGSTTPRPFIARTWYYYPAGVANANSEPIFIGPLSTLVFAQIQYNPGISVADAVSTVSSGLGVDGDSFLDNYLEDNSTEANLTHIIAEIVGGGIVNVTSTTGTTQDIDAILADLGSIATTANETNTSSNTYNPGGYTPTGYTGTSTTVNLAYQETADLHTLLQSCGLKAFEEWDSNPGVTPKEHKELCLETDADTGGLKLTFTEKYYQTNVWTLDTLKSSGQVPFLADASDTLIDMDNVNSSTQDIYPLRFFPAIEQSHAGGSAIFKSGILEYKMIVSEADISGVLGSNLPKGQSIDPLVNNVTFGTGDKIYKAIMILQDKMYSVDNGHNFSNSTSTPSTQSRNYIVFDEGTTGGANFLPMPNSTDIVTMMGLTDTDFIVEYEDSNNFTKISVTVPYNANNIINTLNIEHISNGSNGGVISVAFYTIEQHNGTPFLVIHSFFDVGQDIFIGKVSSVDSTNFIYGVVSPENMSIDVTQGGYQDGDIMDDIMINTSARDRILNQNSITILP